MGIAFSISVPAERHMVTAGPGESVQPSNFGSIEWAAGTERRANDRGEGCR